MNTGEEGTANTIHRAMRRVRFQSRAVPQHAREDTGDTFVGTRVDHCLVAAVPGVHVEFPGGEPVCWVRFNIPAALFRFPGAHPVPAVCYTVH